MHSNSPSGITRVDDVVSDVVDQVVEEVHPLRVILFGSRATGRAGDHSDIDLLVVMPDGTPPRATMRRLYSTVRRTKVGADMLVTTPSILEQHRENVGLIYSEILETGVDVYVAS
ncbi:MAG: nucleotidyltransferase domain-containing protein [Bacteroidetes bacterium]|nr:nucleotidyltransferase domain-containing protein [Bacteroidota bacterium]